MLSLWLCGCDLAVTVPVPVGGCMCATDTRALCFKRCRARMRRCQMSVCGRSMTGRLRRPVRGHPPPPLRPHLHLPPLAHTPLRTLVSVLPPPHGSPGRRRHSRHRPRLPVRASHLFPSLAVGPLLLAGSQRRHSQAPLHPAGPPLLMAWGREKLHTAACLMSWSGSGLS